MIVKETYFEPSCGGFLVVCDGINFGRMTVLWKKRTGGNDNRHQVESGSPGNPMSIITVTATENIGAANNAYRNGCKTGVLAAEAALSFAALKGKETHLHDELPSYNEHYEQIYDHHQAKKHLK